jgi:hypothetical protein
MLMAAGYEIDMTTSQKVGDAIWLDHPARARAKEKTLIVYNDGLVVGDVTKETDKEELRIYPEDEKEFNQFVSSVPRPTLWEKSQKTLSNVYAWLTMLLIWIVVYLVFSFFLNIFSS